MGDGELQEGQAQRGTLAGALGTREPVGEVDDHAGEEPGLGEAQQEAQDVEHRGVLGEAQGQGDQTPGEHDPREPDPRAHLGQDQVRRRLEQEVADEEDPGADAMLSTIA